MLGLTFVEKTAVEQELDKAKKQKRKKEKKAKKKKDKHKKLERKDPVSSDASLSDDAGDKSPDKEEVKEEEVPAAAPREDWMAMDFSAMGAAKEEPKNQNEVEPEAKYAPGLNVVSATGGLSGLPPVSRAPAGVGDGGSGWRLKALKRAQEQAKQEGADLAEVVKERWGSVAELVEAATSKPAAEGRPGAHHRQRGRGADLEKSVPHYLQDVGSSRNQMRMPKLDDSLSWRAERRPRERRDDNGPDNRQHSGRETSTSGRDRNGFRYERDGRRGDREGQTDRDEDRSIRDAGEQNRKSERAVRENDARITKDRRNTSVERDEVHGRSEREWERRDDRARRSERDTSEQAAGHRERERDRREAHNSPAGDTYKPDRSGGQDRGNGKDNNKAQQRPGGRRSGAADDRNHENQELLQTATAAINQIPNDGSFMDRFRALQQKNADLKAAAASQRAEQEEDKAPEEDDRRDHEQAADDSQPTAARAPSEPVNNHSVAALLKARLKQGVKTQSVSDLPLPPASSQPAAKGDQPRRAAHNAAAALRNKLVAGKKGATGAKEEARSRSHSDSSDDEGGVEVLPQVDQDGRAVYGAFGRDLAVNKPGDRGKNKVQRYGADGKRERYFKDDDDMDLDTLVKRAKYGDDGIGEVDEAMARSIMTSKRFKEAELDADAEYDLDAGLDRSEDRRKHGTREQQMQRERARQISQHQKLQSLEDRCKFCFKSEQRPKHLTVAIAQTCYLSLVERGMLATGHCYIAPLEHIASTRKVDDHSWTEIRNFQKCLIRMFMEQGKETIFMETAMGLNSYRHHAVMECLPVDKDIMAKAPLYFKKGIDEAESEWSQHHAKRLIQTKEKGLRGCIPPNFPYFYVQFGYSEGFVHVIDDESKWNPDFGRQILVGLMKLPAEEMHRRQRADSINAQQQRAAEFAKQWDPYDWTKQLEA